MAVVNQYKFFGVTSDTSQSIRLFSAAGVTPALPLVSETYIIKSITVLSAATPIVVIVNDSISVIRTVALTGNVSKELLTQPLIVEGGKNVLVLSSTSDAIDVGVSYLNIKKEVTE